MLSLDVIRNLKKNRLSPFARVRTSRELRAIREEVRKTLRAREEFHYEVLQLTRREQGSMKASDFLQL